LTNLFSQLGTQKRETDVVNTVEDKGGIERVLFAQE